ncbi:MAG: ATP-binding protein [Oscillospiraceae bacterium]|nr:ATP-binding protein [Oscillospiraceae bacterium]
MKKLPIGIQTFRKIIEGDYIYVDKTEYVYKLVDDAKHYFLSRPRRFGKSLLLDTIQEVFNGEKELFKGLFIYDTDYSFEKHPIIRFDMLNMENKSPELFEEAIMGKLINHAAAEEISTFGRSPGMVFESLLESLHKKYGKRVVVLIDEYDKPILDNIENTEIADANRQIIRSVFNRLKSCDRNIEFTFITGVSKFTKVSLFSDLNHLIDLTMSKEYAGICGIPVEELGTYFGEYIKDLENSDVLKNIDDIHDEILHWYDGYSWDGKSHLINPFSLLNFFNEKRFYSFWFASGSPSFLIKLFKNKPSSFLALKDLSMSELAMDSFDIHNLSAVPLLFQTGYLTVKNVISEWGSSPFYAMEMPNREVSEAFNLQIIAGFTEAELMTTQSMHGQIKTALETGELQKIVPTLRSLFASIPYQLHVNAEAYYHSIFLAMMTLLNFEIHAELSVAGGSIDAVLELDDRVYVCEFKYVDCKHDASDETKRKLFDKALGDAINQIKEKGYSKKFEGSGKLIHHIALAFLGRDNIEMLAG